MSKRYILNKRRHTVHDREHLTEKCNTDQISHRDEADSKEEAWRKMVVARPCLYCMRQGWPK